MTAILAGAPHTRHGRAPLAPATRTMPALLACSHGTSSPAGQRAVAGLVQAVADRRPDVAVAGSFVDVQQPDVPTSLTGLGHGAVRIVPLLLSAGYHVHVDLTEAAATNPDTRVMRALGPDPRLVRQLQRRLTEAGLAPGDAVVLAAAGSSDANAVAHCEQTGEMLAAALRRDVITGFISAAGPRLGDAVATARAGLRSRGDGAGRVVVATYLLAPGYFADLAAGCGADVVTAPLLVDGEQPPAELVDLVLDRYLAC
ncbi:sirohydrochlorin chelatase [Occultella aeris]|nr:CbiX/SirB N-terminal domain-containing protein [Occultella aeris]